MPASLWTTWLGARMPGTGVLKVTPAVAPGKLTDPLDGSKTSGTSLSTVTARFPLT